MNQQSSAHLEYDQLLQALVDTADLGGGARNHLKDCPTCQRQVNSLAQRYDRLGQMAKKMAPEPARAFRVPDRTATRFSTRFRPVFAMGIVAAMIMVFTVWGPQYFQTSDSSISTVALNSDSDDLLSDDIDALVADALPVAYQELASVFESESVEDLIEWIVPSIDEDDEVDLEPRA